jgi:hypothetical protein
MTASIGHNPNGSFNRTAIMRNAWALAKQNTSGTDDIRRLPLIKRLAVFLKWEWTAAKEERQAQHAWRPHYRAEVARIGREAAEQFCRATLDYDRLSGDRPSRDQMALASRMRTVLNEPAAALRVSRAKDVTSGPIMRRARPNDARVPSTTIAST